MFNPDQPQANEGQIQERVLTPELIAQLESKGIKIMGEYPKVIYCGGNVNDFDFLKTGITKPVVLIQSRNRRERVVAEGVSINDALDSISKLNTYKDFLEKHQTKFSRASVAVARKFGSSRAIVDELGLNEDQKVKLKEDFFTLTHAPINFGGIARPGQLENAVVYLRNIREDLARRMQLFNQVENFCIFIESDEATSADPKQLTAQIDKKVSESLHDPENFKQIVKNSPYSFFIEVVEKQGIKWKDFCQMLSDYYTNYFPTKFEEMAQLQDDINVWLQSLKPDATEKEK